MAAKKSLASHRAALLPRAGAYHASSSKRIPELPETMLVAWEDQNEHGRRYYDRVTVPHRRGRP
jgi:hypothetical protein